MHFISVTYIILYILPTFVMFVLRYMKRDSSLATCITRSLAAQSGNGDSISDGR